MADPGEFDILREARVKFPTPRTTNAPINLKPAGGGGGEGRAWGGDFIVIVGPEVGLLTDLAFPGEGIFEFVFAQRGSV